MFSGMPSGRSSVRCPSVCCLLIHLSRDTISVYLAEVSQRNLAHIIHALLKRFSRTEVRGQGHE